MCAKSGKSRDVAPPPTWGGRKDVRMCGPCMLSVLATRGCGLTAARTRSVSSVRMQIDTTHARRRGWLSTAWRRMQSTAAPPPAKSIRVRARPPHRGATHVAASFPGRHSPGLLHTKISTDAHLRHHRTAPPTLACHLQQIQPVHDGVLDYKQTTSARSPPGGVVNSSALDRDGATYSTASEAWVAQSGGPSGGERSQERLPGEEEFTLKKIKIKNEF